MPEDGRGSVSTLMIKECTTLTTSSHSDLLCPRLSTLCQTLEWLGWRDSMVQQLRAPYCFFEGPGFAFPAPTWWFTAVLNSSSRSLSALFWLLKASDTHDIFVQTDKTNIKYVNLNL